MFILHVEIPLKEGAADKIQEAYDEVYEQVITEKGCKTYKLSFSGDRMTAVFFEIWESDDDLSAHLQQPYIMALLANSFMLAAGKPKATKYNIESIVNDLL
jgi:quinol monooxygenase YgiN